MTTSCTVHFPRGGPPLEGLGGHPGQGGFQPVGALRILGNQAFALALFQSASIVQLIVALNLQDAPDRNI